MFFGKVKVFCKHQVMACGACYEDAVPACHGATAMCVGMVGSHPVTQP